jgi:sugar lactone lactonase YvrE
MLKLVAAALAALALSPVAAAAPAVDGVFDLPGRAKRLALGADGGIWITLESGGDVARVSPQGAVERFDSAVVNSPPAS